MPQISAPSLHARAVFWNELQLPAVIEARAREHLGDLLEAEADEMAALLRKNGAVLFRGFPLDTAEDFQAIAARCFGNSFRSYLGGISPRGQIAKDVYESTRLAAQLRISQHNEMAYLPIPPRAMAFFCQIPPAQGGETPLSDARLILKLLPRDIRSRFEAKGVRYHRHLYGPRRNPVSRALSKITELHCSWMAAFATDDPAEVERICAQQGATVRWNWEQGALISNSLPATREHPETGEALWFNHVSTFLTTPQLTGTLRWLLYHAIYPRWQRRPFHAAYGDGEPITLRDLNGINRAIEAATVRFPWQRGDCLFVDNFLVAHGRMPFRGPRRILVAIH